MQFSTSVLLSLVLSGATFAAPASTDRLLAIEEETPVSSNKARGLLDDFHKLQNATAGGIINTIKGSIENPKLTLARVEVVTGLSDTQSAVGNVASQATASNNPGVSPFVTQAQGGLSQASTAINSIGQALISNNAASIADQKSVALGIKTAQDAILCMNQSITNANPQLSSAIASATTAVGGLRNGGESVIASQNKSFADLGLPDNFDSTTPDCSATASAVASRSLDTERGAAMLRGVYAKHSRSLVHSDRDNVDSKRSLVHNDAVVDPDSAESSSTRRALVHSEVVDDSDSVEVFYARRSLGHNDAVDDSD